MIKPISITTSLLSLLLLLSLLACPATANSPKSLRDVIEGRRLKRSYRPRDLEHLIQPRTPVNWRISPRDTLKTPEWAVGVFPGDWSNSVGRETPLSWEYTGCDLNPTDSSPNYEDGITAAANLLKYRGDEICVPKEGFGIHHCNLVTSYRSAHIYFCGNPGIDIKCSEISDIIVAFGGPCATFVNGVFRERGTTALFVGGWPLDYSKLSFLVIDGPGLYKDF